MSTSDGRDKADLEVRIGPLALKNPVMTASGTYGYGNDIQPASTMARLGAVCTKGLSLKPRDGNPPPRIWETDCGMLNAIGLANMGMERFLKKILPDLKAHGVTVVANIFGECDDDFKALAGMVRGEEGISALELNISCPNVKKGGVLFGRDPALAAGITKNVIRAGGLPVIVKLTPAAENLQEVAKAVEEAGACAVTAVNTFRGMAIDPETGMPRLSTVIGGLSGPAIKPIALRMVYELYTAVSIPIIASGGIFSAGDALEYMMAGAAAVQTGTGNLIDPATPFRVLDGIADYCAEKQTSPAGLTGLTHRLVGSRRL